MVVAAVSPTGRCHCQSRGWDCRGEPEDEAALAKAEAIVVLAVAVIVAVQEPRHWVRVQEATSRRRASRRRAVQEQLPITKTKLMLL